jgi:hypothetical protein
MFSTENRSAWDVIFRELHQCTMQRLGIQGTALGPDESALRSAEQAPDYQDPDTTAVNFSEISTLERNYSQISGFEELNITSQDVDLSDLITERK